MMAKRNLLVILLGITIAFTPSLPQAKTLIKAALEPGGTKTMQYKVLVFIKKELEKNLPGKVDLQIFPGGQLGKDAVVLSGMRQGTHMMSIQASIMPTLESGFGIFEAPFLFSNRNEARKVIFGPVGKELIRRLEPKGLIAIGIGELGFRQISNNVRPIYKPSDLEGMKLRIPNNPLRGIIFSQYGANPTPMTFSEVFSALRQGVIDGQENPLLSIYSNKLHEVQKYISLSNHVFTPIIIQCSKIYFDRWPAEVQKALLKAGERAAEYSFQIGEEMDKELVFELMKTCAVNRSDSAAFKKASSAVFDEVAKKSDKALLEKALAAVSQ